jgi:hypothetical protein
MVDAMTLSPERGPSGGGRRIRRAWYALALAVLAVGAVTAIRPANPVPLYDGIGFPDEPYRWLVAPAGTPKTPPVTPAAATVTVTAQGATDSVRAFSAEQGPQIAFALRDGALAPPAGATSVHLVAQATPNPSTAPQDGTLVSNVYRLTATAAPAGAVALHPGSRIIVNLRSDKAISETVLLESFSGGKWTQQATTRVGTDIYAGTLPAFGDFALVRVKPGTQVTVSAQSANPFATNTDTGSSGGALGQGAAVSTNALWIGAGIVVILLTGGLILARRRMSSRE